MRLKTQFIVCLIVFTVILFIIAASVASTEQQVSSLNDQQDIAHNIEQEASDLNSISTDYFLYQENLQLSKWQAKFSSLTTNLAKIKTSSIEQQTLINNIAGDLQNLNTLFNEINAYLQNVPRNLSIRIDPAFQFRWSSMAVQSQTLTSDAVQLSQSINDHVQQVNATNTLLILLLVGTFGTFLAIIYLMVFRKTLKSVTKLQEGINIIGNGNFDYKIKMAGKNEIAQLSHAFNQMTSNLRTVTASKSDLEKEILRREKVEVALRISEERWATTLSSIGDAVIATDTNGKVLFMNRVAEALTGWKLSEVLYHPINEPFHIINEYTRKEVESPVVEVIAKGIVVGLANHTILICKDASEIPIDDSGAPIKDKEGNVTGVVLIFRDIIERKKAEEALRKSEQEYRSLFVNMIDGFAYCQMIFDNQGKPIDFVYLEINDAFEKITGLKREDVIGKKVSDAIPGIKQANPELFEIYGRVATTCLKERFEVFFKPLNMWLSISVYCPVKGYFAAVFEDITDRKNTEAKFEEYSKNLEELVEERTKSLKDAERLATIGSTAGMVGHDIRNPLQAIASDVFLIKSDLESVPGCMEKEGIKESIDGIEKNIDYINKIVQDLQDYARPLNPIAEETNLEQIIEKLLEKDRVPENIKVSVKVADAAKKITSDSNYLNRILYNLVTNAVQAMPDGGKLTIQAYKEVDNIVLMVKDTGMGIPEEIKNKMFTLMFTTKSKGQGFGLPVVKRMTEALDGTVEFESKIGKGTKFIIRLPPKK